MGMSSADLCGQGVGQEVSLFALLNGTGMSNLSKTTAALDSHTYICSFCIKGPTEHPLTRSDDDCYSLQYEKKNL